MVRKNKTTAVVSPGQFPESESVRSSTKESRDVTPGISATGIAVDLGEYPLKDLCMHKGLRREQNTNGKDQSNIGVSTTPGGDSVALLVEEQPRIISDAENLNEEFTQPRSANLLPVRIVGHRGSKKRDRPIVHLVQISSDELSIQSKRKQRLVGTGGFGKGPILNSLNVRQQGEGTKCNVVQISGDNVSAKGQMEVDVFAACSENYVAMGMEEQMNLAVGAENMITQKGPTKRKIRPIVDLGEHSSETVMSLPTNFPSSSRPVGGEEENGVLVIDDNPINVRHVDTNAESLRPAHGHLFADCFEVPIQDCEEVSSWKPCNAVRPLAIIGENLPVGPLVLESASCCLYCNAKKFMYETSSSCCCGGQVVVAANQFPDKLCRLYLSEEEDAKHFKQYSRMSNNLFAYSSIRGKTESTTFKGIYLFKMHGQVYHSVPDLLPNDGSPKFLQLYFYDGQHEVQNRVNCFPEVREDIIRILMKITEMNPYARFFRSLREIEIDEDTQIVLSQNPVLDQRVYNAPVSDEVAAVWPDGASSSQISTPHIIVHGKSAQTHRICHYYGCYDPLQYLLLFPFGECGWTQNLKKRNVGGKNHTQQVPDPIHSCTVHTVQNFLDEEESRTVKHRTRADKYISPREYYAYVLQMRPSNMLLRSGRCFQQFVVDMYVKIENSRLDYLRNNQDIIRADLYQGIHDSVTDGETDASKVGHLVVLPPSFIGCLRDLKRRYLNAMALVQRYGKPDLFITMTCNANWPEIKCELQPGEKAQDRPDIVARIFCAKLLIRGPSEYDKFVCAEIPSFYNPRLRKVVLTHMMHGPCGKLNPKCPCMRMDGKKMICKNGYPKDYNSEAANNKDGYPVYRRRPTGHDRISFKISATNEKKFDEIEQFQSSRWVSPCEGIWRIFGFDLFENFPPVMPLPVHLPNMQSIAVRPFENFRRVVRDPKRARTPLTEYFAVNASVDGGVNLLYSDFPEHYTWNSNVKEWKDRKNALTVVGRISFVLPAEGERYYLRLLLLNVRNSTSFTDLCTVDNYVCATFQETAKRLGLLEDDDAASICLTEAAEIQLPCALRRLFATILIFCQPSDPASLWEKYYASLSEDYRYQFKDCPGKAKQLTVSLLEQHLESMGKSLKTFGLDHLGYNVSDEFRKTRVITDALNIPIPEEYINSRSRLNEAQLNAYDVIMNHVKEGKGGAFFIDGPGDTGKTFLYNSLYAEIRMMNKILLPTASSGIAASNLPSGRTTHSRFKIPVDHESCFTCDVPKQGSLAQLLKETALIIWDEASMANKANLQALDLLLQDICENTTLFGGKLIIFGGDFRQVLPVVPQKSLRHAVESSIVASYIWPSLKRLKLTENQRAREDPTFCAFLLSLSNGELQTNE
ncbi:uncharacterized protein LOC110699780 [Chenopodium quinoa]|uniref:uncharacterized protein LOC110699780 n=1 Tax=Chenopodium quinoa TaxID=63459 RepID=UPI000B78A1D0|nr:uncharacterized protein LOC110699780 [Chenopodium quinoa]